MFRQVTVSALKEKKKRETASLVSLQLEDGPVIVVEVQSHKLTECSERVENELLWCRVGMLEREKEGEEETHLQV